MKVLLFTFAMILGSAAFSHGEECLCGQDGAVPAPDVPNLALEVSALGMAALHPEGRSFQLAEDDEKILKLKGSAEAAKLCSKKKYDGSKLTLVLRGFSRGMGSPMASDGGTIKLAYDALLLYLPDLCKKDYLGNKLASQSIGCTAKHGERSNYEKFGLFLNRDVDAIIEDIKLGYNLEDLNITRDDIPVMQAFYKAINMTTSREVLAFLSSQKNALSNEQKLKLVQMFGKRFDDNYDDARANAALGNSSIVSPDTLFRTAAEQEREDYYARDIPGYKPGTSKAGVCRDIAVAQAQMLKAMGFEHTYIISYKTAGNLHTAVVTQDPAHSSVVHKISYDNRFVSAGETGVKTLVHEGDVATNYLISDANGKSLKMVPSEMGKFLTEAAGFDVRQLEPMAQVRSNLVGANLAFNEKWQSRVFWGQDAAGAMYMGAGANASYGKGSHTPGKIGAVLAVQDRPETFSAYSTGNAQLETIYLQIEQKLKTNDVKLPADVQARLESTLTAIGSIYWYQNHTTKATSAGMQGDLRLEMGVSGEQGKNAPGRFSSRYFAGVELAPAVKDVRDTSPGTLRPIINRALFTADGRAELARTPMGRAYLIASAKILADAFGVRQKIEAGVATEQLALTGAFESRVSGDFLPFIEGSETKTSGHATIQPWREVRLDVEAYRSMENDPYLRDRTGMFATLIFKH